MPKGITKPTLTSYLSENTTFYSAMFMLGSVICFRITYFIVQKTNCYIPQEGAGDDETAPTLTN